MEKKKIICLLYYFLLSREFEYRLKVTHRNLYEERSLSHDHDKKQPKKRQEEMLRF